MHGLNAARADDTTSLKQPILKYIIADVPEADTAFLDTHKVNRGWNHPLTAELLCPLSWEASDTYVHYPYSVLTTYLQIYSTYTDIINGRKKVTANYWPRFLYPAGHKYDPNDLETGLLKGDILFRVSSLSFPYGLGY